MSVVVNVMVSLMSVMSPPPDFTNPVRTGRMLDVCLCCGSVGGVGGMGGVSDVGGVDDVGVVGGVDGVGGMGGVSGEWVEGLDNGLEGWCYVCVRCESGFSV